MPAKQLRMLNVHYALLQSLFWAGFATIWAFLSVLLLYRGFTNSQIGTVTATALLLPLAVQPGLAALADRDPRVTSRRLTMILTALAALAAACMWLWGGLRPLTACAYVLVGVCLTVTQPFLSSMAMQWRSDGVELNFGLGRGLGSACYAAMVLLLGQLTERRAPTLIVPVFLGLFLMLLAAVWRFPAAPVATVQPRQREQVLSNRQLLKKYPTFTGLLVACALLIASHSSATTYMIQIVKKTGSAEGAMGTVLALAAFLELPAMALFTRMRRRFSLKTLLRLCAGAFVARMVLYRLAQSMALIYLGSVLQFFSYGIFVPVTVYYVTERIDRANQVKGQALISMASSGVGSAIGSLCCGMILDRAGANGMLLFDIAAAGAGFLVMLAVTRQEKA